MQNTIYKKSSGFLPKEAELRILCEQSGVWKEIGKLILNLSDFIEVPAKEQVFHLHKCPEKDGVIFLSISCDSLKDEPAKSEYNMDELVRQLNDSKNKLSSLKNDYNEVCNQKDCMKIELLTLQQELQMLKETEGMQSSLAIRQEK